MAKVRKVTWTNKSGTHVAWGADYFDLNRKRHLKTFASKEEADAWLANTMASDHIKKGQKRNVLSKVKGLHIPLSIAEILSLPRTRLQVSGVYFLFLGEQLQYIGQTTIARERLKQHRNGGLIPFDDWHFLPAVWKDLGVIEELYIREYDPPFNRGFQARKRGKLLPTDNVVEENWGLLAM
jgi:hypothetical protein